MVPEGIVDTLWFAVEQQCREWGDEFDVWQDGLGQISLGLTEDGLFAATVGGITFSIPRQVAKTFIVTRIVMALCALFPNTTVLWTAHRVRTATQTFEKLKGFAGRPAVRAHLQANRNDGLRSGNGQQEIQFRNGSSIMFGAREQGFGRGFDEVDVEVFDEAQILTEKALEDMVAATNQSRFPHGALLFYMGTPPRPVDPGEEFANRRRDALAAKPDDVVYAEAGNAVYVECSADPSVGKPGGPSLDDPSQVAIANPSYPHRTPPVSIARLRANLKTDGSWRREGLGVWDDDVLQQSALITVDQWTALAVGAAPKAGVKSFGVKFAPDGSRVALVGAMKRGDASVHLELVGAHTGDLAAGTANLVDWFVAEVNGQPRWRGLAAIAVDGLSHAGAFVNALHEAGVSKKVVLVPTWPQVVTANGMLLGGVQAESVTCLDTDGQALLAESVTQCGKKMHGDKGGWSWTPLDEDADEIPVMAASLALWAAKTSKRRPGRRQTGTVM